jgi:hypothetical protein
VGKRADVKELPPRVYMFFGEAVADSPESGCQVGDRHSIIGFASARNIEDAAQVAADHFLDAGWTDIEFTEGEEFDLGRLDEVEDEVADTCRKCLDEGSSGIVFRIVEE